MLAVGPASLIVKVIIMCFVGIVLQWNMILTKAHAKIATYQIFGYKQRAGALLGNEWKKVNINYVVFVIITI